MDPFVTKQAVDVAQHYIDKIVDDPMKAIGGLLADKVNYWRYKNRVNTVLKAKKFLEEKGIDPHRALPETVIPLIEAAGDTEDPLLSSMFAGLLATNVTPDTYESVHPSYARVLAQLAPLDALILKTFFDLLRQGGADFNQTALHIDKAVERFGVKKSILLLSFQNVWRLGLCSHGPSLDFLNQAPQLVFTDYGVAFMRACTHQLAD